MRAPAALFPAVIAIPDAMVMPIDFPIAKGHSSHGSRCYWFSAYYWFSACDRFSMYTGFPDIMVFRVLLVFYIHWFSAYITPSTTPPPPLRVFGAYIPFFPGALPPHAKWTGPPPLPPFLPRLQPTHCITRVFYTLRAQAFFPPKLATFSEKREARTASAEGTAAPESPSVFGPPSRASDGGNVGFGLRSFKGRARSTRTRRAGRIEGRALRPAQAIDAGSLPALGGGAWTDACFRLDARAADR